MDEELKKAVLSIAQALRDLGNGSATTSMGAVEAHSVQTKDGLDNVGDALQAVSTSLDAMSDIGDGLREVAGSIDRMTNTLADVLRKDT